ncbi:MAG: cytidylate kinase [Candidatus Marivariicella framensis]|jgi:cytidylate kinase|tara:strand:+ start:173 stop:838 length:666 start_codon:yes stop_codon:yes gene_type:complete
MKKIIAIDGHAATGKSSQAKKIANFFGYNYIDTGAMYRAVTYYCIISDLLSEPINVRTIIERLNKINIEFKISNKSQIILLNGNDVEPFIRKMDVAENVSKIAGIPEVRSFLVKIQRQIAIKNNVVMDGRDIGTVVFPNAKNKFFLTASLEIRAKRRFEELKSSNETIIYSKVLENVKIRDYEDSSRLVSPLKPAKDAIIVETSNLTENEVFERLISLING